mgnify:CR=1 FL=1
MGSFANFEQDILMSLLRSDNVTRESLLSSPPECARGFNEYSLLHNNDLATNSNTNTHRLVFGSPTNSSISAHRMLFGSPDSSTYAPRNLDMSTAVFGDSLNRTAIQSNLFEQNNSNLFEDFIHPLHQTPNKSFEEKQNMHSMPRKFEHPPRIPQNRSKKQVKLRPDIATSKSLPSFRQQKPDI